MPGACPDAPLPDPEKGVMSGSFAYGRASVANGSTQGRICNPQRKTEAGETLRARAPASSAIATMETLF
jgi:hypothetical protein